MKYQKTSKAYFDALPDIRPEEQPGGFCFLCERSYATQADWRAHADACMDRAAAEAAEAWAKRGREGREVTKLSPTDLMRAALIVEGQAIELEENGYRYRADWSEIEDLKRLATGLRELACSTN